MSAHLKYVDAVSEVNSFKDIIFNAIEGSYVLVVATNCMVLSNSKSLKLASHSCCFTLRSVIAVVKFSNLYFLQQAFGLDKTWLSFYLTFIDVNVF